MHVSELLDAIRWEVSIESSASDLQLVNNIADERIVFSVFEHGLGVFEGLRGHRLWPSAASSSFGGCLETSSCVFHDQFPLELVEYCGHMKEEPSFGGAGIDVLREHFQSNATLADVSDSLDDLSQ